MTNRSSCTDRAHLTESDKAIIEWCASVCENTEIAPDAGVKELIWHAAAIARAAAAIRALKGEDA